MFVSGRTTYMELENNICKIKLTLTENIINILPKKTRFNIFFHKYRNERLKKSMRRESKNRKNPMFIKNNIFITIYTILETF